LRPPEGIYGNAGSANNLEWTGRYPQQNGGPQSNKFMSAPFDHIEQGIYGHVTQEQIYNRGPPAAQSPHVEDNIYGKSNFQMIQAPVVPKKTDENINGGRNLPGWSVGEAKRPTDAPLYGNLDSRDFDAFTKSNGSNNGLYVPSMFDNPNNGVLGRKQDPNIILSRRPDNIVAEPPQRKKGTSPSYRRKFPAWSGEAQKVSNVREQENIFQNPVQQNNSPIKPLPFVQNSKEISINQPRPMSPVVPAVPQNRPPPPVSNDPIMPGVRKSVFGIFPRESEVHQNLGAARQTNLNAITESNDKPVALVQPRKVQGIRVFPTGDDIYSKVTPRDDGPRGEVSRPVMSDHERGKPGMSDDHDQPVKDREIASMFGKLNFDNTTSPPQNNFEKSLGYLP